MSQLNSFSSIIATFAKFELGMIATLSIISGIDDHKLMVIMRGLQYTPKRDTLYSYMELYSVDPVIKEYSKLFFDEVNKYSGLRNHIAHSIWVPGERPDSVMPLSIKIQGGKGRLINDEQDQNRHHYTTQELIDIQNKLSFMHNSYVIWLRSLGFASDIAMNMDDATSSNP
jgi:hypothetical protein